MHLGRRFLCGGRASRFCYWLGSLSEGPSYRLSDAVNRLSLSFCPRFRLLRSTSRLCSRCSLSIATSDLHITALLLNVSVDRRGGGDLLG